MTNMHREKAKLTRKILRDYKMLNQLDQAPWSGLCPVIFHALDVDVDGSRGAEEGEFNIPASSQATAVGAGSMPDMPVAPPLSQSWDPYHDHQESQSYGSEPSSSQPAYASEENRSYTDTTHILEPGSSQPSFQEHSSQS
jgi:hypothetical protein